MIFLLVIKNILNNVLSINIILVIFNRRGHDDLGDHHFECGDLKWVQNDFVHDSF